MSSNDKAEERRAKAGKRCLLTGDPWLVQLSTKPMSHPSARTFLDPALVALSLVSASVNGAPEDFRGLGLRRLRLVKTHPTGNHKR